MSTGLSFMCLDLRRIAFLAWSFARARALQQLTQLEWQPYRESKVLNAVYCVLRWKEGPGTVEIRQDQRKIDALTRQFFDHTFESLLEKSFTLGPMALAHYAESLVSIRSYALESVQQMFRDASSINAEVRGETQKTINTLAAIKLGSALALTGAACFVALTGTGVVLVEAAGVKLTRDAAVKSTADVAGEIVKPHDHIGENVKGIAYQLGKDGADLASEGLREHAAKVGEEGLREYGPKLISAEQRIERYSAELLRKVRAGKAAKFARRMNNATSDAANAERAIQTAERTVKAAKFAGKAVPLVFAAWDVIDAIGEYAEDTEGAE